MSEEKKKSLLLKLHDTEYHIRSIHILHKCLPDRLELRPALSPALTHPRRPRGRCEGKSKQKYGRAPEDNVLPDQFQTVAAVLTSDWCQKTCVFLAPIRSQNGGDRWNWSGKTLSPGALLAVLYFSSCHIFPPV